jgi:hypothetical protein
MVVVQNPQANTVDHRPMPAHQGFKRRGIALGQETLQQLAVRQAILAKMTYAAQVVDNAVEWCSHIHSSALATQPTYIVRHCRRLIHFFSKRAPPFALACKQLSAHEPERPEDRQTGLRPRFPQLCLIDFGSISGLTSTDNAASFAAQS